MTQQATPPPDPGEAQLTFSAIIEKTPGMSLGLDVALSSAIIWMRHAIFVKTVFCGGSVAAWNEGSEEPLRVRAGDLIFQVNAIRGDTEKMIQEMKAKQRLTLHILRRAGRSHSQCVVPLPPPVPPPMTTEPPGSWQQSAPTATSAATIPSVGPNSCPPTRVPTHADASEEADTMGASVEAKARPSSPKPNGNTTAGPASGASVELSEDRLSEAESGESSRGRGRLATVEELLPQLRSLGSEALGGLIAVALHQRPWLYEAVLGERGQCSTNDLAGDSSAGVGSMFEGVAHYEDLETN